MKSHLERVMFARLSLSAVLLMGFSAPALAQSAGDSKVAEYSSLLEQISNLEMNLLHQEAYIQTQQAEIASLEKQIAETDALKESVGPMLDKMVAAIDAEITTDIPFKGLERGERFNDLVETVNDENAAPGEKMRKALNIYNVEVNYGQSLEAYAGNHPDTTKAGARFAACEQNAESGACGLSKKQVENMTAGATLLDLKPELMDGDYLRYGRVALVYMLNDGSEALRYDPASKSWETLSAAKSLDVRRAIRIAKGEAAPGVVTAPVYVAGE